MQIHEAKPGDMIDIAAAWIQREPDATKRQAMWMTFLSELHRRMGMWCEHTPTMKSIRPAMEEIGIHLTDFIEPTKAV